MLIWPLKKHIRECGDFMSLVYWSDKDTDTAEKSYILQAERM